MRLVSMLLFLLVLSAESAAQTDQLSPERASAFQAKIQQQVAKMKTLIMDIEQVRVLHVFEDQLKANGIFYLGFPKKVRWEITTPYQSAIIYNDNQVAKFEKKGTHWQRLNFGGEDLMRQIMSQISAWSTGKFSQSDLYNVQFLTDARIALIPKSVQMRKTLNRIELQFDQKSYLIQSVTLKESGGDYVKITFSNPRINTPIPDGTFNLKSLEAKP